LVDSFSLLGGWLADLNWVQLWLFESDLQPVWFVWAKLSLPSSDLVALGVAHYTSLFLPLSPFARSVAFQNCFALPPAKHLERLFFSVKMVIGGVVCPQVSNH